MDYNVSLAVFKEKNTFRYNILIFPMIILSTALQHSCDRVDSSGFAVFGSSLLLPAQGIV